MGEKGQSESPAPSSQQEDPAEILKHLSLAPVLHTTLVCSQPFPLSPVGSGKG